MKHAYIFLLLLSLTSFATAQTFQAYENGRRPPMKQAETGETGFAIYYADYLHGEPTSLGETYDMNRLSCAHNTHALGTMLKVTRIDNGASVTVRVNDRGPLAEGCIVLLSKAAAIQMDLLKVGKTRVRVEVVGYSDQTPGAPVAASSYESVQPRSYGSGLTAKGVDRSATAVNSNNYATRQPVEEYDSPRPAQRQVPAATQKNTTTPRGLAGAQYIVQYGSYRDYDNASRHASSLQTQGESNAVVREMNTPNGLLYKVTSAVFADKASAQQQLENLRNSNITDGIVVTLK
ncbi:MAG: septal ring lytic transglycosylase RlpA family protein [Saprospiraceae bacterium]|nr:septal ring lytic transglycosylase RlpA family protein [Saprospiraceae bacterium]